MRLTSDQSRVSSSNVNQNVNTERIFLNNCQQILLILAIFHERCQSFEYNIHSKNHINNKFSSHVNFRPFFLYFISDMKSNIVRISNEPVKKACMDRIIPNFQPICIFWDNEILLERFWLISLSLFTIVHCLLVVFILVVHVVHAFLFYFIFLIKELD